MKPMEALDNLEKLRLAATIAASGHVADELREAVTVVRAELAEAEALRGRLAVAEKDLADLTPEEKTNEADNDIHPRRTRRQRTARR